MTVLVCVPVLLGLAVAAMLPAGPSRPIPAPTTADPPAIPEQSGWMLRWRPLWCVLGGFGFGMFVGGAAGWVGSLVAAVTIWVGIGRAEPPGIRRQREAIERDLPAIVRLLGAAMAAGASPAEALATVISALPGGAADRLALVVGRLQLGGDPGDAWRELERDAALAPLGRTLARSHVTGSSVVTAVQRLGVELARDARSHAEDRARSVGVKAAVPLGLCLLPAFVLIGVVPVVGGLLAELNL